MAFGGKAWPIEAEDTNLGSVISGSSTCGGGTFGFQTSWGTGEGGGNPFWIIRDASLKNVYSVFRSKPT